jgi:hypothetical protein
MFETSFALTVPTGLIPFSNTNYKYAGGTWTTSTISMLNKTLASTVSFNFTGTSLTIYGCATATQNSDVSVSVDGVKVATIVQKGKVTGYTIDYSSNTFTNGTHYVVITNNQDALYYSFEGVVLDSTGTISPFDGTVTTPTNPTNPTNPTTTTPFDSSAFLGSFFSGFGNLISSIFVPSDNYFKDKTTSLLAQLQLKYGFSNDAQNVINKLNNPSSAVIGIDTVYMGIPLKLDISGNDLFVTLTTKVKFWVGGFLWVLFIFFSVRYITNSFGGGGAE